MRALAAGGLDVRRQAQLAFQQLAQAEGVMAGLAEMVVIRRVEVEDQLVGPVQCAEGLRNTCSSMQAWLARYTNVADLSPTTWHTDPSCFSTSARLIQLGNAGRRSSARCAGR